MPLYQISNQDLRDHCKRYIETLEFWLRRLINDILSKEYGIDYWNAMDSTGNHLFKKDIREKVLYRFTNYPERFSRLIDATLFEHLSDIVCKEILYKNHFKKAMTSVVLLNREQLKCYLSILAEVRNLLYHANHISVRQAERTVCYSNDIIDSIKTFYKNENKDMDFNAPSIIKYSDSNGMNYFRDQFTKPVQGVILDLREPKLRCRDKIRIEIEVDSSFSPDEYTIEWEVGNKVLSNSTTVDIEFVEGDVSEIYKIDVYIKSNKSWHRYKYYDDRLSILFTILPPIEI